MAWPLWSLVGEEEGAITEGGVLGLPPTPQTFFNRCEILEDLSQHHQFGTSDSGGISENITLPANLILSSLSHFLILLLCLFQK